MKTELDLEYFTEKTLKVEGWYFFYPTYEGAFEAGGWRTFVYVDHDNIDDGCLHCKRYEGTYIGPYPEPPPVEN